MFPSTFTLTIKTRAIAKVLSATVFILLFSSWAKLADENSLRVKAGAAAFKTITTKNAIKVNGKVLNYNANAGYLTLNDAEQKPLANIYYTAYQSAGVNRPITFVFNGGPGSSSVWLHMGAFGPVRAKFKNDTGEAPEGNYTYADNPYTWLPFTDLVFIDPIGTGYSQPADGIDARKFYGYQEDISIIGQFIKKYLAYNHREASPKFLAGESYGGMRAVGLAAHLQDSLHIELAGITLISPVINYQLISFNNGNETPYSHFLPSYAAAAQYHKRLSPALQKLQVEQLIAKAEGFAQGTYSRFLNSGDDVSSDLQAKVIDSLSYFTGLSKSYLIKMNGRVSNREFGKELLSSENEIIGRFDSRFADTLQNADPSSVNIRGLFAGTFKKYTATQLAYQNKLPYKITTEIRGWKYGPAATNSYVNVSATLKSILQKNPKLKVNVAGGYYDLATSAGSIKYAVNHLGLNKQLRGNISVNYYKAGHMLYISNSANAQFLNNSAAFYKNILNPVNHNMSA